MNIIILKRKLVDTTMCNLTHDQIVKKFLFLLHSFKWDNNSIQHTSFELNLLVTADCSELFSSLAT